MQLVMAKESLADLQPVALPAGYRIRHFRAGDETHWENVMNQAFGVVDPPRLFNRVMACDAACAPERVLFVTHGDVPVATASAWYKPECGLHTGYLHYVGVSAAHQGRKLGYGVSLAVLHRLVFEGRTRAILQTDDHRVPAIKTYLQLGFEPWLVEEDQRGRWRAVIETARFQALCPRYNEWVEGPIRPMTAEAGRGAP